MKTSVQRHALLARKSMKDRLCVPIQVIEMKFWRWLFKRKHQPSEDAFQGVLKYNTVFVTDESLEKLTVRGFGARRLRQVLYSTPRSSSQGETPAKEGGNEDVLGATGSTLSAVPSPAIASRRVDTENDKSPMILFDEEAFFLFRLGILELQHEDGTSVTEQELWGKFLDKNNNFALKYKVYSYFRERNYVVKTGIHYGLDYAIYRTLPTHCHSELCALVVDGTQKTDVTGGLESAASTSQVSWRHVSTMTRVMPDVMKLLLICHVLPEGLGQLKEVRGGPLRNADILSDIFAERGEEGGGSIDYSTPACLDKLKVYPQTCLVRRLPCKGDEYESVGDIQDKYRACSILRKPRLEQVTKKKRRKRRDHMEVRVKAASRHNKLWKQLMETTTRKQEAKKATREEGEDISKSAEKKRSKKEKAEAKEKRKQQEEEKSRNLAAASAALATQDPTDLIAIMNAKLAKAKEAPAQVESGSGSASDSASASASASASSTATRKRSAPTSSGPSAADTGSNDIPTRVTRRKTQAQAVPEVGIRRSSRIRAK